MGTHSGAATDTLLDMTIASLSSLEPDLQRGRKRRRDFFRMGSGRAASPLGESATFRGRCRYRSSSRYMDMLSPSRPTSQPRMLVGDYPHRNTAGSPSPSRRKMIRIMQFIGTRQRNQPPSRSQSPYTSYNGLESAQDILRRRRQRTQSRSRVHTCIPTGFGMTSLNGDDKLPFNKYQMSKQSEPSAREQSNYHE
ncbi:hypothetical protein GGS21DRAFT_490459 [Xylaria nigripes]|nr:hypothetical protein GGS21DRAFT_490459 [Xylaria nigripes]